VSTKKWRAIPKRCVGRNARLSDFRTGTKNWIAVMKTKIQERTRTAGRRGTALSRGTFVHAHNTAPFVPKSSDKDRQQTPVTVDSVKSIAGFPCRLKRILVPTDFSKNSRRGLQYALAFAKQCGASITLLHAVHAKCSALGRVDDLALEEALKRGEARELSALVQRLLGDQVSADIVVRIGSPATEIVHAAEALGADLIIISTHGRTGLKHLLLGSVTEAVVRHSTCPVLVVREREHGFLCSGSQLAGKKCSAIHKAGVGNCACCADSDCETKKRTDYKL
jgi:nucleotide-binding universal stress UspA family protein